MTTQRHEGGGNAFWRHRLKEEKRKGVEITNDEANFTLLVIIATGHHGPHCVIHHSHNVGIIILWTDNRVSLSTQRWEQRSQPYREHFHNHHCSWLRRCFITAGPQLNWIRAQQ